MPADHPLRLPIRSTWNGHPADPHEHADVTVQIEGEHLRWTIDAPFHGDPAPAAPAGPTWGLWEHEVVELFVLGPDEQYLEVELGPHGHHLVLRLHGRRRPVETLLPLTAAVARPSPARWTADAWIPTFYLPPRPWHLNVYAIWGQGAARRYLAWTPVPGPAPDFHRLEYFVPTLL